MRIDRIGLKDAHVYLNPFITVSVKGTDKTFRSLDNWHLQLCIKSANIAILWSVRYTAFFVIERVKRAWLACKIELSSSTRKGAGLHSVEREIVSARKTFSSLSPASTMSSEQEWREKKPISNRLLREPKALIPFTGGGNAPVKEASWNNQNISFLRQLFFFLNYPVPEKRSLIEIFPFTRLRQRETETSWAVFLFSGGSPRNTRNEGVSSRLRNKRDCLTCYMVFSFL